MRLIDRIVHWLFILGIGGCVLLSVLFPDGADFILGAKCFLMAMLFHALYMLLAGRLISMVPRGNRDDDDA